ncbi:MerR family transcriptional regulator [Nocardioidaceae bacterium]|nr:MerR family transcriptional regulator [Nocardioidaceae bacterium]
MLTVKQAAQRAGISPTTLRAWERRYDVLEPGRTPAGYRIYDEAALDRLRTMAALVHAGWSPSKAADHIREQEGAVDRRTTPRRRPDGSVPDPAYLQLAEVAEALDSQEMERLLDTMFAREDLEEMLVDWLIPSMAEVGLAWAEQEISVAGEHVVSSAVLGRLSTRLQQTRSDADAPRVMVGLPEGARHELGAMTLALLLQRRGLQVQYLASDLPAEEWVRGASGGGAAAAVVVVPLAEDAGKATQALHALHVHGPRLRLYVGGPGAEAVEFTRAHVLGADLRESADLITRQLRAQRN